MRARRKGAALSGILGLCLALLAMPSARPGDGVNTPFTGARSLFPPEEKAGFTFAILGDRTGGPESGLLILEQAVVELNRLDPDLVMTVGDLINGYNRPPEWIAQMKRFKRIMSRLKMPWYPTPGNHDVYPPGQGSKDRTNESLYLQHFGPLYYSFDHGNVHFVVLYSDENLSFRNPAVNQQMSLEQLEWLRGDLDASAARHVFVFLHHPRWNYEGDVWEPVHAVMTESGKVTAVFAGHWHRYRSDGERDGIRYYCLATTGAQVGDLRAAGELHHYNLVSVRDDAWSMTVIPVGSTLDPDFVTGRESDDVQAIREGGFIEWKTAFPAPVQGESEGVLVLLLVNPTSKTLPCVLRWTGLPEERWKVDVREMSIDLAPAEERTVAFTLRAAPPMEGESLPTAGIEAEAVYRFAKGGVQRIRTVRPVRYAVPEMPIALTRDEGSNGINRALLLDGQDDCVVVDPAPALNPEAPFTLECWARLEEPPERSALLAKTESSAYGIFLSEEGRRGPAFSVYLEGQGYASAAAGEEAFHLDSWTHFAGVFDGESVRLYVNGRLAAETPGRGIMKGNELPLILGADVDRRGRPVSFCRGLVDEVRLSAGARYRAPFEPERRFRRDGRTLVLLHLDRIFGDATPDTSGGNRHGKVQGGARLVEVR